MGFLFQLGLAHDLFSFDHSVPLVFEVYAHLACLDALDCQSKNVDFTNIN